LKLVKYLEIHKNQYEEYIREWEESGENIVPYAATRMDKSFAELQEKWKEDETEIMYQKGFVPSTLYFLIGPEEQIYGAIHFRHQLNDRLRQNGGHIGYGIRPSKRQNGYASEMLSLLLDELWKKGYREVLITCDDDNAPSAKTIEKNGGILRDKPVFEGKLTRRYWINAPGS